MAKSKDPDAWLVGKALFVSGGGLEWSGFGPRPEWLQSELDLGAKLSEYLNPKHPLYSSRLEQLKKQEQKIMPKQIMGPFNLNEKIRFKPTAEITQHLHADIGWSGTPPPADADGFVEMSLWAFMFMFGHRLYVGSKPLIEDNNFFIVLT